MKIFVIISLLIGFGTGTRLNAQKKGEERISPQVEAEVMKLLDEYMSAWNRKDLQAWEQTFHFPHYRLAGGKMTVLEHPGLQDASKVWASAGSDWHHSKWDRRRIIHASADKVHVDTMFTRYRADGSKIGTYESLYIVTKEYGKWGVKMRSSFAQ